MADTRSVGNQLCPTPPYTGHPELAEYASEIRWLLRLDRASCLVELPI